MQQRQKPRRDIKFFWSAPWCAPIWLPGDDGCYDPSPLKWSDLSYDFDMKEDCNGRRSIPAEEIVAKLRQVDVLMAQGDRSRMRSER